MPFQAGADIYLINTCSVTENADKKCRKIVSDILKLNHDAFIAMIGCYAQLKPREISDIPGVDIVLGAAEKFNLLEHVKTFEKKQKSIVLSSDIREVRSFNKAFSYGDRTRTFLKVQDGCNYNCSFCTIPLARGKSRSPEIETIVEQAKEIAATDVKEVVLTGVNIGDFGIDADTNRRKHTFLDLIRELDKVDGIDRWRISSIEPNLLSDDIIDFVANSDRFMPHFHIPLQSGSDKMLKLMRRRYRSGLYRQRVDHIRRVMPHACIGVDVITGFNGESEAEFLTTYNFINELDVNYLHVFTYSERDNTPGPDMEFTVPYAERKKRSKMLRILSEKKKRAFYESQLGTTHTVLFEKPEEDGSIEGWTENYVRVRTRGIAENTVEQVTLNTINETSAVDGTAIKRLKYA